MIASIVWAGVALAAIVLAFVAWERHAIRTRATTDSELEIQNLRVDQLNIRVDELERIITTPVTGLKDILLTMRNAQRMGK